MLHSIKAVLLYLVLLQDFTLTDAACPPDQHAECPTWAARGDCLDFNKIALMQCECATSCQNYALCDASLGDVDCKCASRVWDGECTSVPNVQAECAYTCQLRNNITCNKTEMAPLWDLTDRYPNFEVYRYADNVEYLCKRCTTSDGGIKARANHICQANGTWLRHPDYGDPYCIIKCQDDMDFCVGKEDLCYYGNELDERWQSCAATCDVPAQCHTGQGETTCDCGWFVKFGHCESDSYLHDNICPVTCNRRDTITCVEPESYPHATPSSDRRYFATLNYTCDTGYVNKGGAGTRYCKQNTAWARDAIEDHGKDPNCQQSYGDLHSNCSLLAQQGLCETDSWVSSNCSHTCLLRTNTSCPEPDSYTNAGATSGRRYLDIVTYFCKGGITNTGREGKRVCMLNQTWLTFPDSSGDPPNCTVPPVVLTTFTKLTFPQTNLVMEYMYDVIAASPVACGQLCLPQLDCTHFLFLKPSDCNLYNLNGTNPVNISTSVIWRRNYFG